MFTQIIETKGPPIVYDSFTMGDGKKLPPKKVLPIRVDEETAKKARQWQNRYRKMSRGEPLRAIFLMGVREAARLRGIDFSVLDEEPSEGSPPSGARPESSGPAPVPATVAPNRRKL